MLCSCRSTGQIVRKQLLRQLRDYTIRTGMDRKEPENRLAVVLSELASSFFLGYSFSFPGPKYRQSLLSTRYIYLYTKYIFVLSLSFVL